jgi:hypothetical protein
MLLHCCQDLGAGIAQGYGLDDQGFESQQGLAIFLFTIASWPAPHQASYPVGIRRSFPRVGVKRPGREADYLPPSSAEMKEWVELYLHSPNLPSWRDAQLKHGDSFTFIFITLRFCYSSDWIWDTGDT